MKNESREMSLLLAAHAAPLFAGDKISNIITVDAAKYQAVCRELEGTNISIRPLKCRKDKILIMLYRPGALLNYLSQPECKRLLKMQGYTGLDNEPMDLVWMLRQLARRIYFYHDKKTTYPHEIGLFLGYPLEDVRGFIDNKGEHCSFSGYWKVYGDVEKAKCRFADFERDKARMIAAVMSGYSIRQIAV